MKKLLTLISIFFLMLSVSFAKKNENLRIDEQQLNTEFKELNKLEQYVNTHEGITLEEVKKAGLTEGLNLNTNISTMAMMDDLPLNIPAFWWGCVLGLIGVLVVYLVTDKDQDQTKKALWGCLVSGGVIMGLWLVALIAGSSLFWWR
jgi:hypothetical protein